MNIAVIGGGASGMIAAIIASTNGAEVTIFEHMPRMGKKLLLTGSGKCNISNTDMDMKHFHGSDKNIISAVLSACPREDTQAFFEAIGLYMREKNGYLYPYSEQASAVVDVLRFAIRDMDIEVYTETDIKKIEKVRQSGDRDLEDMFVITTNTGKFSFDRVILCCGSSANRNTGSDGSGYRFAKDFGHTIVKPLPALTYLVCEDDYFPSIAGIRTNAKISLFTKVSGQSVLLGKECGQIQFIKNGISGICVFDLSHLAVKSIDEGEPVKAMIDLLPDISWDRIFGFIKERIENIADRQIEELFIGLFAKPLGTCICKRCNLDLKAKGKTLTEDDITELCHMVKEFEANVISSGGMDDSQVAQGGVDLSEVKEDLESRLCSGLFFAGEILDVNGDCGGYNLQWAQSSAMVAGKAAAK